ncbi:M48 family metallopeptidase [Micavibrio aeruginosavorus]|uniref:M48 family metallopeptidase n=1 Tax=Micavibrio aeruginosavorus TaxID=349221 RepID=UPI003F4AB274
MMFRFYSLLIICGFLVTGCAGSAYQLPQVSNAEVRAMEEKLAQENKPLKTYKRSDKQYKNTLATISSKLSKSAKPLCEDSGYKECRFKVTYSPDDTVNAYASEGYKITIHKGLLQYLKNNDEMAAVVAHEMGHHLAQHNEETMQNAAAGAAVSGILTAVLLGAANANNPNYNAYQQQQDQQTIEDMMNVGSYLGVISYSKEQEREADLLATYLLSRAGYNLKSAQNVMVVLAQFAGEKSPSQAAFLDTHPAGTERVVAWQKAIDEIKQNPSKLPYPKQDNAPKKTSVK